MNKKVKILQVCAIDLSVAALLKPLIEESMEEGYIVHNACTNTGRFDQLTQHGFTMIDIPIERRIHPISNIKSIWKLYRLMRQERYDIVHVHTPIAALLGRIAAKLARTEHIIYTAHGFYFHEGMSRRAYRFFYLLEKYSARWMTDWLLLQSKEDYELCIRDKFKSSDRTIHISNGVDIHTKFHPELVEVSKQARLKEELGIREEDIVFSYIGRFVREKGMIELIEAFQSIKHKLTHAKLLLIGETLSTDRDQALLRMLDEIQSDPDIIVAGFRQDIPELLSISDIFVLPSYREGLPRSIIEAMAMAKPIIATNIRGCREEVFHGENGYLVQKQSVDSLSEHMVLLGSDSERMKQFGLRSRMIVEEMFDEMKVVRKQIDLFQRLSHD